jgi:polar amino acid transport system substrate-binding protein
MTTWRSNLVFAHLEEPPFCVRIDGRSSGCDVDVARTILQAIGVQDFEPVLVEFSDLIPGLVAGRWTMTTGLFVTAARRELVAFSRPIWALPDGLLVRAGNPKRLASYAAVAADATATLGIVTAQVQRDRALAAGVPAARVRAYGSQDEAARAVLAGDIDAYASVAMAHRGYLRHSGEAGLAVVEIATAGDSTDGADAPFGAFAFAKSNVGLVSAVNDALSSYLGSAVHRALMASYGFEPAEIERVVARSTVEEACP